ncbi:MAG: glycine cleavage system aminomethyltransferase GcvT [archaeon]
MKRLHLEEWHNQHARMGEFAGWHTPIWYTSINDEHMTVREKAGVFDISHMGEFYFEGKDAEAFLDKVCVSDIAGLTADVSKYTCILNDNGGIMDEAVIYRIDATHFKMVCDAVCYDKLKGWFAKVREGMELNVIDKTEDLVLLAIQGPDAYSVSDKMGIAAREMPRFGFRHIAYKGREVLLSNSGYTGENGFELLFDDKKPVHPDPKKVGEPTFALQVWNDLLSAGAKPVGLGCRDSLRIECGFTLYEHEDTEEVNPLEVNFNWMIKWDKDFIGKEALVNAKAAGIKRKMKGFEMADRAIPRQGYDVMQNGKKVGVVTSGTMPPTSGKGIGLGLFDSAVEGDVDIMIRGKETKAKIVKPPFYDKQKYGMKREA